MSVLVDSSVWIDASKPRGKSKEALASIIEVGDIICYTNPIQTEVCQGAKSQLEFAKLWDAFLGFQLLPVREHHWELTAWNYFRCRKEGVTVATVDCLVATIAQSYRIPLWTLDKLFTKIQPIIGFDFYS
ncbi:MAG: PIN domain-containing protein [Proteobacteria bacterium]|nr:PIN domain-containing protein [Pseudomonadota bacterium]